MLHPISYTRHQTRTFRDVPRTSDNGERVETSVEVSRTSSSMRSPKCTTVSRRSPPHLSQGLGDSGLRV